MPKSYHQKLKILYIARLLFDLSDEEHPMTAQELIDRLAQNGISAERKSIYADIDALIGYGMDIIRIEGRNGGYYMASRQFELAELKLLVDSVQASRFITGKKSRELISKLETLTSHANAKKLQRQVVVTNRNKAVNESIYYSVDQIYAAMNADLKIRFQYFSWTPEKRIRLRKNGAFYEVSPWFLTWEDENYYLIAYDEQAAVMKHYRVDKMQKLSAGSSRRTGQEVAEDFDIAAYAKKTFGMFAGEEQTVVLLCRPELTGVLLDRFGMDVLMRTEKDGSVRVRAKVAVSPQFFGWLSGLGTGICIESPREIREEYYGWLREICRVYENNEKL